MSPKLGIGVDSIRVPGLLTPVLWHEGQRWWQGLGSAGSLPAWQWGVGPQGSVVLTPLVNVTGLEPPIHLLAGSSAALWVLLAGNLL